MGEMQIFDLDAPGKLWASTEHEEMNTFFLVTPEEKYTADALSSNPAVDPPHMLMSPWQASSKDADANGVVTLDLIKSGKAKEILAALDRIYQDGGDLPKTVKAIIIATAKDGNKIPAKQLAEVLELELAQTHEVRLKGKDRGGVDPLYVTADAWKKGTVDFLVEVTPHGLDSMELTTSSGKADLWLDDGKKDKKLTIDCKGKDDKPITVHVGVLFNKSQETRQIYHPQITFAWDYWKPAYYTTDKRDIITGEEFTLDVTGKSRGEPAKKSIKVRCEAWAANSDWMVDTSAGPPNVYYHPHC